jgi:hypothetical protein
LLLCSFLASFTFATPSSLNLDDAIKIETCYASLDRIKFLEHASFVHQGCLSLWETHCFRCVWSVVVVTFKVFFHLKMHQNNILFFKKNLFLISAHQNDPKYKKKAKKIIFFRNVIWNMAFLSLIIRILFILDMYIKREQLDIKREIFFSFFILDSIQ